MICKIISGGQTGADQSALDAAIEVGSSNGKDECEPMETVQEVRIKLYIRTDKRTVEKDLGNLDELRWFMNDFFSRVAERRSSKKLLKYVGPERRMPLWGRSAQR